MFKYTPNECVRISANNGYIGIGGKIGKVLNTDGGKDYPYRVLVDEVTLCFSENELEMLDS